MPRRPVSISGARQWSDDDDDDDDDLHHVVAGDNDNEEDEAHDASRMALQMGVDARYRNPDKKYGYQHSKKSGANKLLMQGREGWSDDDDDDDVADFIAEDSHDDDDDDDNEQSGGGRSSSSSSSSDDDDDFEDEDAGAGRRRTSNAQAAAAKAIKKLEKARNERDVHTSPPQPARRLRRLSEGTAAPSPTEELAAPKRKLRRVSDLQEQLEGDSPPTTKKIRKLTRVSDL